MLMSKHGAKPLFYVGRHTTPRAQVSFLNRIIIAVTS